MKKVSMIIPCYNSQELALERMLNSVLNQNYENIEVIMVDDGSTDDTFVRLNKWVDIFTKKGYIAKALSKPNGGTASAINVGLLHFTGDYVCFPDHDDILANNFVKSMVECLDNNHSVGWARCLGELVDENDLDTCMFKLELPNDFRRDNIFVEYLLQRIESAVWLLMVRANYLKKCIPSLKLYENHGPQEWQIVLPLSFYGNCVHVEETLYTHVMYSNSHLGRVRKNFESYNRYIELDWDGQKQTLDKLITDNKDRQYFKDIGYLGFIFLLRNRFEDSYAYICSAELHRLYTIYAGKSRSVEDLKKKKLFSFFAMALMDYFLGLDENLKQKANYFKHKQEVSVIV